MLNEYTDWSAVDAFADAVAHDVAERLGWRDNCTVPGRMKSQNILCPVDFSESSQAAVKAAAEMARDGNARLTLVHVCAPPMVYPQAPFMLSDVAQLVAAAERRIAECKRSATEWGAPQVSTRVAQGAPWDRIVHMAKDEGFDLIVMGTHGRTGLSHALLGSVAEKVVRHAPCAVLVVR